MLAKLPRLDSIRRQRIVHQPHPPLPGDLLFHIPEPYNFSSTGNQFILYDNGRQDRLIIFGTTESIGYIENSHDWFMDGTFSVTPPGFAQLYTFHVLRNGRNFVGIYALLLNKRIDTYVVELLTEVRRLTNDVVPESFMVDFEQAMINALGQMYPGIPLKGCLFHLSQFIFRKVQELGLLTTYIADIDFCTNIRMIAAISFVPVEDVIQAFEELCLHSGDVEQEVLDYFEINYIGELQRGRHLVPRFPH